MLVNITDFFKGLSLKQASSSVIKGLRRGYVLLSPSLTAWLAHRTASKGAAVAFYTLFSMTPILVLTIAVAGYFFGAEAAQGEIITQMQALVGPNGAQAISAVLAAAHYSESGVIASVIATLLLLLGATSVFVELKDSLDEMWGTDKPQASSLSVLFKTRVVCFGLVLVLAFLLLVSLVISTALAVIHQYVFSGLWSLAALVLSPLASLISFGVIASLFAVIYKMLPEAPLAWQDAWFGALFTAFLFTLGKYVIGVYLGNSGVTSGFGAAGSVIALLLWVYYSAQIFFFGAEFTRQFALRFGSLRPRDQLRTISENHGNGASKRYINIQSPSLKKRD
ncbi:YihY/virulence factor BrkB family protein [Methylotuvimicrobium alcaliphilum]|uniref:Ribonuclease BN n=1 Tax=Methylotuvimicrobium alcaliphilum (strain DSM 19304 / NCIMB 14124 / VKM B-2133 / 20Z) TaxID=1091494 RepID=G4SX76_META2|nr:YihY/virulence factor BrkB family protein [Methylotuvimicrobium alcaliphilum]CCE24232.1 Putative ribonuclease BN [Methylotuvimicrobium alcaliphilum 20Z]